MASSSASPPNHTNKYDVFLSFRGEDTRHNFTDHLYHALVRAGLRTFRDNDSMGRGQLLKPEIETAIKQSRASVIVLSENYADSRWCLDELVLIVDQGKKCSHFILPVFYHVDPSDVMNQRRSFAIQGSKRWSSWVAFSFFFFWLFLAPSWSIPFFSHLPLVLLIIIAALKKRRWKKALTEVANLTGMVVTGSETDFITQIVHTIDTKLDLKLVSTPAHLTAIETRAEVINSWLKNEQSNSNVLAICGMGGIGKTTLSQYIYNSNKQKYESSSFLEEIGKHCQQPLGLLGLQKLLLTHILGGNYEKTSSECTVKIEEALQMKRVLIVLDDIDEHDQLAALLGTKAFHTESKIIITTRRLDMRAWFGPISQGCEVYKLKLMNDDESLELLSWHAFGSKIPMEGFKELAVKLAQYCGGNPLALKVLGSSLYVRAEDEQNRNGLIEIWRSTLTSLNSLKGDIDIKIQGILRRSFDSLPREIHKELFLHICFFFVGEYEDYVVTILEHDWHAKAGIMTLINRCLLTVSPSNKVMMHQLLQDMGRQIVREESKNPAKRSRVVQDDESYHVLDKGKGSKTIEGLALNIQKLKQGMRSKDNPFEMSIPSTLSGYSTAPTLPDLLKNLL
ncbi:TMV resistance protein N-like protein [Tanacetum coccineum]